MFKITISIIILPVTFILVCLIGCKDILFTMEPEYPEFVEFVNNSNKTVFIIQDEKGYPDSIAPNIGTTCSVKPRSQNTLFFAIVGQERNIWQNILQFSYSLVIVTLMIRIQ